MKLNIAELDCIFISYDEPNAEHHWADLLSKCMWAKRVHGVKGSDECHKAAAKISDTSWFITVDADNIVNQNFFDLSIDVPAGTKAISWPGINIINGLRYGNGSLKIWQKDFVLGMQTHEKSNKAKSQVDFCWEKGYIPMVDSYSITYPNASSYQAWRAGFREGVKMSLVDGTLPTTPSINNIFWHNLHRLKVWTSVGAHVTNGEWAILGARHGCWKTNCTDWNYIDVRDFSKLNEVWQEVKQGSAVELIDHYGNLLHKDLGLKTTLLPANTSEFVVNIFNEQYQQVKEQITWANRNNV